MTFTRKILIRCDDCGEPREFPVLADIPQRRWQADHAAACSGRKGTTA